LSVVCGVSCVDVGCGVAGVVVAHVAYDIGVIVVVIRDVVNVVVGDVPARDVRGVVMVACNVCAVHICVVSGLVLLLLMMALLCLVMMIACCCP